MYTLKQIEAFYWTARLGSFSAAARKLRTTQSTISKRISELESAIKSPVFERHSKALAPTYAGRRLVDLAYEMLEISNKIQSQVADPTRMEGVVRLVPRSSRR